MLFRNAWVKGNMYFAKYFGLKLCSYSMACPGLFLPLFTPSIYKV